MNMKPIGERVLIKPIKMEVKTESGIILPGAGEKEKPNLGEIVALGKGENMSELAVGNTIVYAKYTGTEVEDRDEKYIILNFEDVLAVIEN